MKLDGKVAIVTGGGSGIGRATALSFAGEGANLVIADKDLSSAEKVSDEVKSLGRQALAMQIDVANRVQVNQMVEKTLETFGKIDVLVNSAGINRQSLAEEFSEEVWDSVLGTNLKGTFLCCQAVGKQMIRQKQGKIINIASTAGHRGGFGQVAYGASKAGIIQLTRVLAIEWLKHNVRVNSVSPGTTMSPMFEGLMKTNHHLVRGREQMIPLGRMNQPEEVASVILFLASPESDNIIGQDILVDGGSCAVFPGDALTLARERNDNPEAFIH